MKLIKIIDENHIKILEYKKPRVIFDISDCRESICTTDEVINPFELFYENKRLKVNENLYQEITSIKRKEINTLKEKITKLIEKNYKLAKEIEEYKKDIEELDKKLFFTKNELDMRQKSIDNKLNQQKSL